jgi:hypothetical protein
MARFDADSSTATDVDSDAKRGLRGATRFAERHSLELSATLAFALVAALGYTIHVLAHQQFGDNMGAILVWFSVIFAAGAALLGGTIKLHAAVKQRRHDWE